MQRDSENNSPIFARMAEGQTNPVREPEPVFGTYTFGPWAFLSFARNHITRRMTPRKTALLLEYHEHKWGGRTDYRAHALLSSK